jgi:hypothetical protein
LLRADSEWPSDCRAPQTRYKLAPFELTKRHPPPPCRNGIAGYRIGTDQSGGDFRNQQVRADEVIE